MGTKAENPEEKQLPMPPDLEQSKLHDEAECGFLGGSRRAAPLVGMTPALTIRDGIVSNLA